VEVSVVCLLDVVDEEGRAHRDPVGRRPGVDGVECRHHHRDVDTLSVTCRGEGLPAATAVVQPVGLEHTRGSREEIDDLAEQQVG
jgi:hypothetical protein